jgi:hypothetical protein
VLESLQQQHAAQLRESGVSEDIIRSRGYRTVTAKAGLRSLGFKDAQCLVPTLLVPIWNVAGEIGLYHHRPDTPRMRSGKPAKYEFPAGAAMAVDVHPFIKDKVRDPGVPLLITEGVKKADAAISRGLCCIAVVGVWNWRGSNEHGGKTALPDWEGIAFKDASGHGRKVFMVYDSDVMLKKPVHLALQRFAAFLGQRGADVAFLYLPHGEDGRKTGLDDYLAGHTTDELFRLASGELRPLVSEEDEGEDSEEDASATASQRLVRIGLACDLFHSERDENFIRFMVADHRETWPVRSRPFRDWLSREYFLSCGKPAGSQAIEDALRVLEGRARYDGDRRELALRTAEHEGTVWLDLGDARWRAVRIMARGWEVVDDPPCLFRRYAVSGAHPKPEPGGSLDELRRFINVRDEEGWKQLVCWLVAALLPEIAHPILVVHGEQGSAKSTLMRILSRLVDPSKTPLRTEPRDVGEWVQAADHSWLTTLDNVSHMPAWLSDALCRAVTGEGFVKRQLYTDGDDVIFCFRRVIALTGIEVVAQRADLLDRAILLALSPIAAHQRRSESEVLREFETALPRLLGALLDVLSRVLRELSSVHLETLPRMADFARVGVAVERALGWAEGTFLAAYSGNIAEQHQEALSSSVIGEAIVSYLRKNGDFEGSAKELLDALAAHVGEAMARRRDWPKSPKILSGLLRRIAPNLRAVSVGCDFATPHGKRLIVLTAPPGSESEDTAGCRDEAIPISNGSAPAIRVVYLNGNHPPELRRKVMGTHGGVAMPEALPGQDGRDNHSQAVSHETFPDDPDERETWHV